MSITYFLFNKHNRYIVFYEKLIESPIEELNSLAEKFKLPIVAVGMGEKETDLQPFNAEYFSKALLGIEN